MVYKEVSRVEIAEIIRQWQAGRGLKAIARSTGISRNTTRKYLLAAQAAGIVRDGPIPSDSQLIKLLDLNQAGPAGIASPTDKVLEPYAAQIEHWLKDDQLKLVRVQDLLSQQHCQVSYTCLRRYVHKQGWFDKETHNTVRMPDTEPGQMAEIDFGRLGLIPTGEDNKKRKVWGMLSVLNYSRHQFLWPLFGQTLNEVIEGLEASWQFYG